jgi:hypothetical protein
LKKICLQKELNYLCTEFERLINFKSTNMSNLLAIESNFLNLAEIKQALNLNEIRTVSRSLSNAKKKKFEQSLVLSKLVVKAVEWFHSDEGKAKCAEEGIEWSNEEIGNKVFGWQKSYFYKVVKAGKLPETTVETFIAKCDEIEAQGEEANRSIEGLLKFAKQVENNQSEGGQGEEGEGEAAETAQVETRVQTIFTMTYKTDAGNVSVRVDANGNVKTTNTSEEIQAAINFLTNTLNKI